MAGSILEQETLIKNKYKQQREQCARVYDWQLQNLVTQHNLIESNLKYLEEQELAMISQIVGVNEGRSTNLEAGFGGNVIAPQIVCVTNVKEEASFDMDMIPPDITKIVKQEDCHQDSKERIKFKQESKDDEYDNSHNNGTFSNANSTNQDSESIKCEKIEGNGDDNQAGQSQLQSQSQSELSEGYICNHCNMKDMTRDEAFNHYKDVHFKHSIYKDKVKKGQCPICGQEFGDKEARGEIYWFIHFEKVHVNYGNYTKKLSDKRCYECEFCNIVCKSKLDLDNHAKIKQHETNVPIRFECPASKSKGCKPLSTNHARINHWACKHIDSSFWPFKCDATHAEAKTPKRFGTIQQLNNHVKKDHGNDDEKLRCSTCKRRFMKKKNKQSHYCTKHYWKLPIMALSNQA